MVKLNLTEIQIRQLIQKHRYRTKRVSAALMDNLDFALTLRKQGLSYNSIAICFTELGIPVSKETVRKFLGAQEPGQDGYPADYIKDGGSLSEPEQIDEKHSWSGVHAESFRRHRLSHCETEKDDLMPDPEQFRRRIDFD